MRLAPTSAFSSHAPSTHLQNFTLCRVSVMQEALQQQLDKASRSLTGLLGNVEHSRTLMAGVLKVRGWCGQVTLA